MSKHEKLRRYAYNGELEVVKFLLTKGADIHHQDKYCNTASTLAAGHGHLDVVEFLVEKDADVS